MARLYAASRRRVNVPKKILLAESLAKLLHQRRIAVVGHAQLLPRTGHGDIEQPASLLVATPVQVVTREQQDVPGIEPLGAEDGRKPNNIGRSMRRSGTVNATFRSYPDRDPGPLEDV